MTKDPAATAPTPGQIIAERYDRAIRMVLASSIDEAITRAVKNERQRITGCIVAEACMMSNDEDQAVAIAVAARVKCDFMRDEAEQARMNGRTDRRGSSDPWSSWDVDPMDELDGWTS